MTATPWRQAWQEALYGPAGFFIREAPADHFRTNVGVPLFARAITRLAGLVDAALGFPDPFDVVDVGAGRGELLAGLGSVPSRWKLTGVDLATADVPFGWAHEIPAVTGLLIANEWLDSVPVDVVDGDRLVLVDTAGAESPGPVLDDVDATDWCRRWWPAGAAGDSRIEVGLARDRAWGHAVSQLQSGLAVAIDYGHTRADRRPTLTGYRDGRQVPAIPDGSCDLTAHVAFDSCVASTGGQLLRQHEVLRGLGISAMLPSVDDPSYAAALRDASQARELLDPEGLGGFGWLLHTTEMDADWMPSMWGVA